MIGQSSQSNLFWEGLVFVKSDLVMIVKCDKVLELAEIAHFEHDVGLPLPNFYDVLFQGYRAIDKDC